MQMYIYYGCKMNVGMYVCIGTDNEVEDNEENAHWNDGLNSDENPGELENTKSSAYMDACTYM